MEQPALRFQVKKEKPAEKIKEEKPAVEKKNEVCVQSHTARMNSIFVKDTYMVP